MIADLKPYPEYKDSGLPWLGQVPKHWDIRRAKFILREIDARSDSGKEQLLRVSQYTGVTQRKSVDGSEEPDTRASSLVGYKKVQPNDLVINIMLAWNGSMGVSRFPGITSPAYCVYRFNENVFSWYFHEVLRSPAYKQRIKTASTGVVESRLRLYSDDLGRIELPLPPPAEQAAIVRFLDWANGRLDRAIRAKRKIITLLNEQKQAIIHRAVTRGLDPDVKLKPSGIPWLGDIPEHWEVRRLKSLSAVKRGASPRPIADMRFFSDNGEYAWVRIKDVTASNHYLEKTTERLSDLGKARSVALEPGAIFLSIAGSVGKPVISKIKCCIHDGFVYFPYFQGNAEFLYYIFSSGRVYAGLGKLGTQLNLNTETVGSIRVPWPDTTVQSAIVDKLDRDVIAFDVATSHLEREIELLREYRTRLVADVVTGKLDVRAAAAKIRDEDILDAATIADGASDEVETLEEGEEA